MPSDAPTNDTFEAYSFDILERSDHIDWISGRLFWPRLLRGFRRDLPGLRQAADYGGRPLAPEVVMAVTSGRPIASCYSNLLSKKSSDCSTYSFFRPTRRAGGSESFIPCPRGDVVLDGLRPPGGQSERGQRSGATD